MAKILVIDDELGILDLLDNVLYHKGHDVVLATDGQSGLKLFQQELPDLTIVDFKMPDVGGMTVLKEIRTLDPKAIVIMLTGFRTEEREWQARQLGAAEILDKNLVLHTLGATLDRVLTQIGHTMAAEEKRQAPRFLIQFPVAFLREGVMLGEGTGFDLSESGCMVANEVAVEAGDEVELRLYLLDHQDPLTPMAVDIAAVRWSEGRKCGLEFLSLPSDDKRRLQRYVRTLRTTVAEGRVD